MFKDLYKKANDKIDTTQAKERVLENICKAQVKPQNKYRIVEYTAAMAACAALTFVSINLFNKPQPLPELSRERPVYTDERTEDTVEIAPVPENTPAAAENVKRDTAVSAPKKQEKQTADRQTETSAVSQPSDNTQPAPETHEETVHENTAPAAEIPDTISESSDTGSIEPNTDSINTFSSEENGVAAMSLAPHASVQKVKLPDGMEPLESKRKSSFADNEIYEFSGNGKYAEIVISDNAIDKTDDESEIFKTVYIDGNKAEIYKNNETFQAYMHVDCDYYVYSDHFTYTELEQLLISLTD